MAIQDLLRPWAGVAYRHIPADATTGVLNFRLATPIRENRWNSTGQPTLYLASDCGVVIGEYARHFEDGRDTEQGRGTGARRIYRITVTVEHLLDLRDPRAHEALSLVNAPVCFLDETIARATADYVRQMTPAQALLVPSMVFLDDPTRWALVLFLEKLPADPHAFLSAEADRIFRLFPSSEGRQELR
ncbi:MAG TPA: RES family NAD+ phosphorylase [Steroidobacteraceae bacterium]|nr:RES family NAD+ phosphorylase [Steroidobacteraceae bacterium]